MLTKEAIEELSKAGAIREANISLGDGLEDRAAPPGADGASICPGLGHVALPSDFKLHDLEAYLPQRRRKRGDMSTSLIDDFAAYVAENTEEAATAFIDEKGMKAVAVLNLGTPEEPGHCDNRATFAPVQTAVYAALLDIANGQDKPQRTVAEWMEDWSETINIDGSRPVGDDSDTHQYTDVKRAISAVRDLTVERASKESSKVADMRAEVSAFESAAARGGEAPLPGRLVLRIEPYHGFEARSFAVRVGVRLEPGKPGVNLTLRIVNLELHQQEMAAELSKMVREAVSIPAVVGSFRVGA